MTFETSSTKTERRIHQVFAGYAVVKEVYGRQFSMKYSVRLLCCLLLFQKRVVTGFSTTTSNNYKTKENRALEALKSSMDGIATHNIIQARDQDALNLAVFAGENFVHTFGHLYPAEETSGFLKSDYTEDIFLNYIQDDTYGVWISFSENNDITGYVIAGAASLPRTEKTSGELKKLYVDRSQFGKGLANALFEIGISWLRLKYSGYPIYIGVYSENFRAIKFYNRYKFELFDEYIYEVGNCRDREFILKESDSSAGLPLTR